MAERHDENASLLAEPHNAHSEEWGGGPHAGTCDDLVWWLATGMCGGCGSEDCHDGPCVDVPTRWLMHRVCTHCEHRMAQGIVPRTQSGMRPGGDA